MGKYSSNSLVNRLNILLVYVIVVVVLPVQAVRPIPNPFCQFEFDYCSERSPPYAQKSTDVINLYYVQAPVFQMKFGPILGWFHLFHSGIVFRNTRTDEEWALTYDAVFEVLNATVPYVEVDPKTGAKELIWCDLGAFCWESPVNNSYWSEQFTLVGSMTGSQFNQLQTWTKTANDTYLYYELWNVMHNWHNASSPMLIESFTCHDGALNAVLPAAAHFGAHLDHTAKTPPLKRDFMNLYSAAPTPVDTNDPQVMADIIAFYERLQTNGRSWEHVLKELVMMILKDKFVHSHGKYYKIHPREPWLAYHYAASRPWWGPEPERIEE